MEEPTFTEGELISGLCVVSLRRRYNCWHVDLANGEHLFTEVLSKFEVTPSVLRRLIYSYRTNAGIFQMCVQAEGPHALSCVQEDSRIDDFLDGVSMTWSGVSASLGICRDAAISAVVSRLGKAGEASEPRPRA